MTRTIAKFAAPALLAVASFAAQAGEGPLQVEVQKAAQSQAAPAQAAQTAVSKQPVQKPVIQVGA
ncbi:MAG: hypothetical protein RJA99_61 [Pseudomonadota bacterium]|jgi:hypothetical protein